jgi:hypothetical protein
MADLRANLQRKNASTPATSQFTIIAISSLKADGLIEGIE